MNYQSSTTKKIFRNKMFKLGKDQIALQSFYYGGICKLIYTRNSTRYARSISSARASRSCVALRARVSRIVHMFHAYVWC